MNQFDEFITFLESIEEINPEMVDSIKEGAEIIFEGARRKKKRRKSKVASAYKHPYKWGGWFPGDYSGGVDGVIGVSDIGMGGAMGGGAGDGGDAGGGE